ncbi:hypothetical protein DFH06DRAFT_1130148 [Mycena polygramma]|nr:hypothetical protein DFH06DRAFT_1130148 [Mycena polygramma]
MEPNTKNMHQDATIIFSGIEAIRKDASNPKDGSGSVPPNLHPHIASLISTDPYTTQIIFLQFRLQYSSLALLYYDFALTFPKEVQYIWKERFRLSTALYICCRYALIANVLYLLAIAHKLGSTGISHAGPTVFQCDAWYKVVGALSVLGRAAVIAVFSMRTYAVFAKSIWVAAYMGIVGITCVALDIVRRSFSSPHSGPKVLHPDPRSRDALRWICLSANQRAFQRSAPEMLSILMVIFESSSAFLTTVRCIMAIRAGGGMKSQREGIMFMLFEQGILYFFTISIFTTAAVVLNYITFGAAVEFFQPGFFQRLPNAFTLPLSCILTARFILYLREWEAAQVNGSNGHRTEVSTVEFHAASRSGVLSSIVGIDDFGGDPVAQVRAVSSQQEATELQTKTVHTESESERTELDVSAGGPSHAGTSQNSLHKGQIHLV